jgi:hypothetical protein
MLQVLQQGLPGGALVSSQVGAAQEGLQEDTGSSSSRDWLSSRVTTEVSNDFLIVVCEAAGGSSKTLE